MVLSGAVDPQATYVTAQYLVVVDIVLFGAIVCAPFSYHDRWLFGDGSGWADYLVFHTLSFFTLVV